MMNCAKTAEPIEMLFGKQMSVGPRNIVLDVGPDFHTGMVLLRGGKNDVGISPPTGYTAVMLPALATFHFIGRGGACVRACV